MKILSKTLFCLWVLTHQAFGQQSALDLYQQEIKPLLQDRCFACHGALKQESGLRVDTVAAMEEHGILGDDYLLDRLVSEDHLERMPPEGEPLSAEAVAVIRLWIEQGAPAPENEQPESDPMQHWAFQRIEKPTLPITGDANPIDAFIAAAHQKHNLKPQRTAPHSLLRRRLYLDVVGLPPTVAQLEAEQPIHELIEDLLSSPQYGERWARHWMDIWRYSDWYGLDQQLRNSQKHLWHWREWIVDSLNADKGYDQMLVEMLAGDELAPEDLKTLAATGFLARNYYLFNRTTWLDDTIEHTAKAFLGLTLNCAKCHDHKYDPIDHEDYYRFRAIFEPHHVRLDALPGETDFTVDGLPRVYDDKLDLPTYIHRRGNPSDPIEDQPVTPGVPKFLAGFSEQPVPIPLPVSAWAPGSRDYSQRDQLSVAAANVDAAYQNFEEAKTAASEVVIESRSDSDALTLKEDFKTARPEVWETIGTGWRYQGGLLAQTVPTIERSGLRTKASHPTNFELDLKFQITGGQQWQSAGIRFDADASGDQAHTVYLSAHTGGPKVQLAHTVSGRDFYPGDAKANRPIQLNHEYDLNVKVRGDLINVALDGQFLFSYRLPQRREGSIEVFAFDATADFYSLNLKPLPKATALVESDKIAAALDPAQTVRLAELQWNVAKAQLAAMQAQIEIDNARLKGVGEPDSARHGQRQLDLALANAELALLKASPQAKASAEQKLSQIKSQIKNGDYPESQTLRGSQRALDQGSHKPSQYSPIYPKISTGRRTALSRWVIHRDNPLTARVAVNHIWNRHFGKPLVDTVFDFGRRAPAPRHQELLDYLASELIESGWSMKHLHRLILNSKTWQRSSSNDAADPATLKQDPENDFYWRMNSRPMESQVIRDSLLSLSGQLDMQRGGPSIVPGPNVKRRSLYLVHSRDGKDKFISTFDDADVFQCYRRDESIVPQRALAMMNSREAYQAAVQIAARFEGLSDGDTFAKEIFQLVLARQPTETELAVCLGFLQEHPNRVQYVHALLNHNDFQVIR